MGAIQVKNVPEELHDALRRRARGEGKDLQDYVLDLIRRDLALPSQGEWLQQLRGQPSVSFDMSATETLEAARAERERSVDDAAGR